MIHYLFLILSISIFAVIGFEIIRWLILANRKKVMQNPVFTKKIDKACKQFVTNKNLDYGTWTGFRDFVVVNKVDEGGNVFSYYLKPSDENPIPSFIPGQYLTFALNIPGQNHPVTRCYSLSDSPFQDEYYRISIKRILPTEAKPNVKPGLASNYFYQHINVGNTLQVKAPAGNFTLDHLKETPVVMIAGGIGITPLLSMLNMIYETGSKQKVHFFYAVLCSTDHIMKKHLAYIADMHPNIHLHVFYASPLPSDEPGLDYQQSGYLTVEKLKQILPSNNFTFYLCGPPAMLAKLHEGLENWGVPLNDICYEAFGPASIQARSNLSVDTQVRHQISYLLTDYQAYWEPKYETLLQFSEAHGINMRSGCRSGRCGICMTRMSSGEVRYITPPQVELPSGNCLPCIATPLKQIEIEA